MQIQQAILVRMVPRTQHRLCFPLHPRTHVLRSRVEPWERGATEDRGNVVKREGSAVGRARCRPRL